MAQGKLISLRSVLYDLSTMVEEKHWNETIFYEWAAKAFLKFRVYDRYETCIKVVEVENHKAQLPSDTEMLLHVAYKQAITETDLTDMIRTLGLEDESWNPAVSHMEFPESLAKKALFSTYLNRSS